MKKLLIGGAALRNLGSSRSTLDIDYLISEDNVELFYFDSENNIDYINAAKNEFFAKIWAMEADNKTGQASPKALIELKAYAFVQHCQNFNFQKADDCEYDMKFLVRHFNVKPEIVKNFCSKGEWNEIQKVISSVKK